MKKWTHEKRGGYWVVFTDLYLFPYLCGGAAVLEKPWNVCDSTRLWHQGRKILKADKEYRQVALLLVLFQS